MANTDTPLMRQYLEVKSRIPDALLFFRLGDFYELFFEDARTAARELEITLTSRNKNDPDPTPMCGVPFHSAAGYINRLVASGHKVAICEQLENPAEKNGPEKGAETKSLVKRDIVRVVSPGTQLDPDALNAKAPNCTHAACSSAGGKILWATCDFTTGKFRFGSAADLESWLATLQSQGIAELLFPENDAGSKLLDEIRARAPRAFAQTVPEFYFDSEYAASRMREQFAAQSLAAVHPELSECVRPAGALVKYFQESQRAPRIPSVNRIEAWGCNGRMELDPATVRALELLPRREPGAGAAARDASLLTWIDRTKTAMGGRLLRDWILRPLTDVEKIDARLGEVASILEAGTEASGKNLLARLTQPLSEIYDLERLSSRISLGMAGARDLRATAGSILMARELCERLGSLELGSLLKGALDSKLVALSEETLRATVENPPLAVREGGMFARGFHADLDELIGLTTNGEAWLAEYEAAERKSTAINSLKVRFNRVFGYYIEITKANLASVPAHYVRKQTTVGGERFITEELKRFEEKILTAEKKRNDLEYALFREFCARFTAKAAAVSELARQVAHVDIIAGFAALASREGYVRPAIDDGTLLEIAHGRHPTVAAFMEGFVPNSIALGGSAGFFLITGPNMGGKSTVMRQTALITLLAQIGCFVPARSARIGVVDRIFTRIGASDNIAEGSSTFMVEMSEMSFILRNATARSLILLDEIGRGTSTFDGMSLAMALASDIAGRIGARTLFATHYHELTALADRYPRVSNHRMAVSVGEDRAGHAIVRFLYRLEPGAAERSYGILVARLAGLPEHVLKHAQQILETIEHTARDRNGSAHRETPQLDLFGNA
ncbi:MAG: DNA mismatch repair protein MutS [Deltaproteobacteria bacterium]|nr:DNA mismatch repair protein MutS [Deltaproteobacteria bacterium]